jgi:tetratricopeptide (TPR) repeat protein
MGFHLRTGEIIYTQGKIPSQNTFSFTQPDNPWLLHQWWPAYLFYLTYTISGISGLVILKAVLGVITFLIVWLCCRNETKDKSCWIYWAITIGIMFARFRFFARPYMFSAIFLALLFYAMRKNKNDRRWLWIDLPILMALWANTHAGVIYGFVLISTFLFAELFLWMRDCIIHKNQTEFRSSYHPYSFIISLFICIISTIISVYIINPNGPQILFLPIKYSLNPFWQSLITEFHPSTGITAILLYCYTGSILLLQVISRKRFDLKLFISFCFFAILALRSQRSIIMYMIISTPYFSSLLDTTFQIRRRVTNNIHSYSLPLVWLMIFLYFIVPNKYYRYGNGLYRAHYPVHIYKFINDQVPRQNIYNDMFYGGSMLWFLYPNFRPFIDGRCEAYSTEFWQNTYTPIIQGNLSMRKILPKYQINGALLWIKTGHAPSPHSLELYHNPDWALVAFNDFTLFFLQRTDINRPVIKENEFQLIWPGDRILSDITFENSVLAISEGRRALKIVPECIYAKLILARAYMISGYYEKAIDLYRILSSLKYFSNDHWCDYSYALFKSERYEESENIFSLMIDRNINPGFAFYWKHINAKKRGDIIAADQFLNKAIKLFPGIREYCITRSLFE